MAKWPNVPHCYGWLGLDMRGRWWLRDDATQAIAAFDSGLPGARGILLQQQKLTDFIGRNYAADERGCWFFQNGPQRVYVELELVPWIWHVDDDGKVCTHTGRAAHVKEILLDEVGRVFMLTDVGFGLVLSQDMGRLADAIERDLWTPRTLSSSALASRFGYVPSPLALLTRG